MDTSSTATAIVRHLESSLQSVHDGKKTAASETTSASSNSSNTKDSSSFIIWKDDSAYKGALQAYQQSCSVLTDIVTKFSIVIKTDPKDQVLESILIELDRSLSTIISRYEELAGLSSLGAPLRKFVANSTSGLLYQLLEYLKHAKGRKFQKVNVSTGMIWKAIEDVNNLPAGNKMAYKRSMLAKLGVVKDTIREFREVLDRGPAVASNDATSSDRQGSEETVLEGSNAEDDAWAVDSDELYLEEEVGLVERAVALMSTGASYLKALSNLLVSVADRLYDCEDATELCAVFTIALNLSAGGDGGGDSGSSTGQDLCIHWVLAISALCHSLEDVCTDLGAELYSPIDVDSASEYYEKMHSVLSAVNTALEAHSPLLNAEEDRIREDLFASFAKLPAVLSRRQNEKEDGEGYI